MRIGRIPKTKEELKRIKKGLCAICGAPLPKRRKTFCSTVCEYTWWGTHDWSWVRNEILQRDSYKCVKCGFQLKRLDSRYYEVVNDPEGFAIGDSDRWGQKGTDNIYYYVPLVVDHIKPIALGGGEFDRENLQVLCKWCNKIKTKNDMGKIARSNRLEKVIGKNGSTLLCYSREETEYR